MLEDHNSASAIQLTLEQKRAVESSANRIAVIAGPGSGKTRVLTERICHLIQARHQEPKCILAISFSSKAAGEVTKRLKERIGDVVHSLTIKTFHALGLELIRTYADLLGFTDDIEIINQSSRFQLLRKLMQEEIKRHGYSRNVSLEKIQEVAQVISRIKNGGEETNIYYLHLCEQYNLALQKKNCIDFDDMILLARKLLTNFAEVSKTLQQKYTHILIDEVQDMNQYQTDMIQMLLGPNSSLFVVGDDDQCIYEWRGAEPEYLRQLTKNKNFEIIHLTDNFRSEKGIVQASASFIERNIERVKKIIQTRKKNGRPTTSATTFAYRLRSPKTEAAFIADTIQKMTLEENYQFGDFTILLRKRSQAECIVNALTEKGILIKYHMEEASFFDEFIRFLRLFSSLSSKNNISLAINFPTRIIDNFLYEDLKYEYPILKELSVWNGFKWLHANGCVFENADVFHQRYETLIFLYSEMEHMTTNGLITRILDYYTLHDKMPAASDHIFIRAETILEMAKAYDRIQNKENTNGKTRLKAFLDYLSLRTQDESPDEISEQAVNIMTCHHSKGLEFPVVFIPGVQVAASQSMAPYSFASGYHTRTVAQLEGERRLLYVSMTRAIDKLYITCSADPFMGDGPVIKQGFLAEMPGLVLKNLN